MLNKEIEIQEIKLSSLFDGNISTRAAVSLIDHQMNPKAKKVILNFSNIDFISRSFTHELLRFIDKNDREIELIHIQSQVKTMLKMVKASKHTTSENIDDSTVIKLSESAASF